MELLVNHVFLPPKLPQKEESGSESMHECLVQLLRVAAKDYELNANKSLEKEKMGVVFNMLSSYLDIGDTNYARNLKKRFKAMKPGGMHAIFTYLSQGHSSNFI